jgi:hypothetical protein
MLIKDRTLHQANSTLARRCCSYWRESNRLQTTPLAVPPGEHAASGCRTQQHTRTANCYAHNPLVASAAPHLKRLDSPCSHHEAPPIDELPRLRRERVSPGAQHLKTAGCCLVNQLTADLLNQPAVWHCRQQLRRMQGITKWPQPAAARLRAGLIRM